MTCPTWLIARKQYITVSGKSTRPNIVDLGKWLHAHDRAGKPVCLHRDPGALRHDYRHLLQKNLGKGLFEAGNFTTNHWTRIFSRSDILESLKNSIVFGILTATIGILIACAMAYLLQRTRVKGRKIPDFLITLGSGTPSVVIALGLIMTMTGKFGINLGNTVAIMVIAYLIKYLMMGMRTVVSAMSQIHVSLEESSQISGASWLGTMRRITVPLIFPSIAAGWFLIFIPSFYELSMTALLYSKDTKTIGFQLYEYWTYTSQQQASALAVGILLVIIVLNLLLNKLTKGNFSI